MRLTVGVGEEARKNSKYVTMVTGAFRGGKLGVLLSYEYSKTV